jgi:multidrug efflux pump
VFSRFFIDRPIFAAVLSIVIVLAGGLSAFTLPLAQFPHVSPPTVSVSCSYPGASARDVAEAVAAPIEKEVNGVEGMMYMSSSCANDGSYSLTVTFHQNVDLNMAQVLVQNRVSLAIPRLPDVIKATGVTTRKRTPDILMGLALFSPRGSHDQLYLSNYVLRAVKDEISRVPGVGDVFVFGERDYSMRLWVNPAKLAARNLTAGDVALAVGGQNLATATGLIGQQPVPDGQDQAVTLDTLGRLKEAEQFADIILRTDSQGRVLRVKDVARVELGARSEDISCRLDQKPTVFLAIFQLPDANALDTAHRVEAKMNELKRSFPADLDWTVGFTTTPYTEESLKEVLKTLRDAVILVAVVVLVFLQNWRTALIPLIAVPVSLVGTLAVMAAMGFSLNNLTMFGLVLAIGIVVDDAIVVVEAVEHHIEHGLAPREATIRAMRTVSGPVIAVGLVLSAVFVPCALIGGITGLFFRQFALTISASTLLSAFNSLTLSPALAALLLRPRDKANTPPLPGAAYPLAGALAGYLFGPPAVAAGLAALAGRWPALAAAPAWLAPVAAAVLGATAGAALVWPLNRGLRWLFRGFNAGFRGTAGLYTRAVGGLLRVAGVGLVVYAGLLLLTFVGFTRTPLGFIPQQDMGYLMITMQLPDSASTERTDAVMRQIEQIAHDTPGVMHAAAIVGQSFALGATGSNFGSMFINLTPYEDRRTPDLSADAIANHLMMKFSKIPDALIAVFPPPPVRGVGRAGGFAFVVEDRGDLGPVRLQAETDELIGQGNRPGSGLMRLFTGYRANVPQLHVQPNPTECANHRVKVGDVNDTLAIYQGSLYVNDFNRFGRTWQVVIQSDEDFRVRPEQLYRLKVRNASGAMVPLGSLVDVYEENGPLVLTRYNMYPAATINGSAAPGMSSRQAIDIMQHLADRELPPSMAYEWTEISYLELQAGNTALSLFGYAAVAVFLVLAMQYESWALPLAVILVVPLCLLGGVAGVQVAHQDVNVFTQIGFVVLVGLASKNAILIVEYAKHMREEGLSRRAAALEACKLRLRPIVMTSVAFVLGVLPLLVSHGAGFEMRRTLGVTVFSGMIGVTLFGLFLTPVFFVVIDWLGETWFFRSPGVRLVSGVVLGVLSFGWLRRRLVRGTEY